MGTPSPVEAVDIPGVAGVRHRFVTVRGVRLHLAEAGSDAAPAVILLHGFPQHWYVWRDIAAMLSPDRHVIAVDLPGFGWSDPSAHGYSTAERARVVLGLLDELSLDRVDVVGHDWGGRLGFRIALNAPERVRRLVAVSEPHPWPLQRRLLPNVWRLWVTALFEIPGLGDWMQRRRGVIGWFLRRDARDPAAWDDAAVDVYASRAARRPTARAGQRLHAAFVIHDIPRLVSRRDHRRPFATPTLLIAGDLDRYLPAELMAAPRRRRAAVRVLTVPGGHFLLDDNPQDVGAAIHAHLTAGSGRRAESDC